jgi:hypothetical protein
MVISIAVSVGQPVVELTGIVVSVSPILAEMNVI